MSPHTRSTPPSSPPRIRTLPAGAGLAWLAQSLALVRTQPGRLLLLTLLLHAVLGLSQVPVLGIFVMLAVPGLTAGLLQAFHDVAAGRRAAPAVLFAGLASSPRTGRLLALGALLFAAGVVSASLLLGLDAGSPDAELLGRIEQGDMEALAGLDPAFVMRMALALGVAVAVTGTLSFLTIPLIWFGGMRVGGALATGLKAMLVNWKPFLLLGLGLAALLLPVGLVLGLLAQVVTATGGGSIVALLLVMLVLLLFQLAVFGTQYCAYRTIFGNAETPAPLPGVDDEGDDDSQLVA